MILRLLALGFFSCLSYAALAGDSITADSISANDANMIVADNPRKGRRDDRQEGRQDNRGGKQDCRQEEGLVGKDKRDCKQENRRDGDKDDNSENHEQA